MARLRIEGVQEAARSAKLELSAEELY